MTEIAKAIETVAPHSIITSAVPKSDVYYEKELTVPALVTKSTIATMDEIITMSDNKFSFGKNLKTNIIEVIVTEIEQLTIGQNTNELWFKFRKTVITASKAHDVLTKMKKVNNGLKVDMCSLKYFRVNFCEPRYTCIEVWKGNEN